MRQVIGRDLDMQRFLMLLLGIFAIVALSLAAVGLYGLVAYSVTQRTIEVGIRMALGATPLRVIGAFLGEMLMLAFVGVTMGLAASVMATRLLSSLVFGVTVLDPLTFTTVAALLAGVTGVATLIPALRAARVDPMRALRLQ
jgi:putative ABC transport system permease protein